MLKKKLVPMQNPLKKSVDQKELNETMKRLARASKFSKTEEAQFKAKGSRVLKGIWY